MATLSLIPVFIGFIFSLFLKDMKRSLKVGFLSGAVMAILTVIIVTSLIALTSTHLFGIEMSKGFDGFITIIIIGGISLIIYFGILGLIGGALGSLLFRKKLS